MQIDDEVVMALVKAGKELEPAGRRIHSTTESPEFSTFKDDYV
jgi:hypothetical protein